MLLRKPSASGAKNLLSRFGYSLRMIRILSRSAALLLMAIAFAAPAFASEPEKGKAPGGATANPEANAINQRNPRVIHAGPGKPTVGDTYVPAGVAKEKKSGGH
jgi:hypothetical protein